MALRVLLADESSTIKKVMQLALADFGVEVKSVPVGLDVVAVTKSFKPDIIFADVLLTKMSGYEVCADLKQDPETTNIPVVLMWSGFMEIDEAKVAQSRANGRLEKPFDADHLRNLVSGLVPKTQTNPVSNFLSFPQMPEFEERPADDAAQSNDDIYAIPEDTSSGFANIPSLDNPDAPMEMADEEFSAVPLTMPKSQEEQEDGEWAHQDLSKFKINIPDTENDFASKFVIPQDEMTKAHIEVSGDFEEISFEDQAKPAAKSVKEKMMETLSKTPSAAPASAAPNANSSSTAQPKAQQKMDIAPDMMEKILREEAREVIEAICWKILPEIAERVVREEINKILRDSEKNI
ncbi:Response regulator PleD [compost metagenome]